MLLSAPFFVPVLLLLPKHPSLLHLPISGVICKMANAKTHLQSLLSHRDNDIATACMPSEEHTLAWAHAVVNGSL